MSTPGDPADPGAAEPSATEPAAARAPRRTDTKSPHRSRARALKILFQADVRGVSPDVTLARLDDEPAAREIIDAVDDLSTGAELLPPVIEGATEIELVSSDQGVAASGSAGASADAAEDHGSLLDDFTRTLVTGVHEDRVRIDGLIARFARKWQISRMPVVDRTILRLATYELIHEDTSPAIVIDEAVGLAKAMSTDDSGRYVNGVLESIRRELAANPLPREVPDEVSAETEELLDLAVAPAADESSSPSEVEATDPSPEPGAPEATSDPSEVEPDPPASLPDTSDVQDEPAEAATGGDDASLADEDPAPADEAAPGPVTHGQPSLFEDSLGR